MAIPWLVVLQSVPWAQVISNAPKVAEGARKLWNAVSKKSLVQEPPVESPDGSGSSGSASIVTLHARLAAMERATAELHDQMLASSELIKTLADQNAQLIGRIEANRVRVVWLAGATVVFGLVAVLSLALVLAG
jgi:hypothetical protein